MPTRVFVLLLWAVAVDATPRAGPLSAPHQSSLKARSRITTLVQQTRTHTISFSGCCHEIKASLRIRPLPAPRGRIHRRGTKEAQGNRCNQFVLLVTTADGFIICSQHGRNEWPHLTGWPGRDGLSTFDLTRFIDISTSPE